MPTCNRYGFTLFEMSIVLLIIASMTAGGAAMFSASLEKSRTDATNAKLATIQQALLDYRRAYNRLPCPADATLTNTGTQYFGVEANAAGDCISTGTIKADFSSGNIVEGMVPTKTLQMPDDYAFDGWGRRFMYVVDNRFTAIDAFSSIPVTEVVPAVDRITVTDETGTAKTTQAAYAVLCFGPDGHGAYPRNVVAGTRISFAAPPQHPIVNVNELTNCHCSGIDGTSATFSPNFVQGMATQDPTNQYNLFDDILVYATRGNLHALNE